MVCTFIWLWLVNRSVEARVSFSARVSISTALAVVHSMKVGIVPKLPCSSSSGSDTRSERLMNSPARFQLAAAVMLARVSRLSRRLSIHSRRSIYMVTWDSSIRKEALSWPAWVMRPLDLSVALRICLWEVIGVPGFNSYRSSYRSS